MIGHPGERLEDIISMKARLKSLRMNTTDVQVFTPSPGTLSTAMYCAESSPASGPVPVVRDVKELMRRKDLLVKQS
jgi:radical SAM superfamily enzyme YgiQ (UPF0313 family)